MLKRLELVQDPISDFPSLTLHKKPSLRFASYLPDAFGDFPLRRSHLGRAWMMIALMLTIFLSDAERSC